MTYFSAPQPRTTVRPHRLRVVAASLGLAAGLGLVGGLAAHAVTATAPTPATTPQIVHQDGLADPDQSNVLDDPAPAAANPHQAEGFALADNITGMASSVWLDVAPGTPQNVRDAVEQARVQLEQLSGLPFRYDRGVLHMPIAVSADPSYFDKLHALAVTGWGRPVDGKLTYSSIHIKESWVTAKADDPVWIDETVAHEIGHAIGLAHFSDVHNGQLQVMNAGVRPYTTYRDGDANGIRWLAAHVDQPTPLPVPPVTPPRPEVARDRSPHGTFRVATVGGQITVSGYALDPDSTGTIETRVTVDGDRLAGRPANLLGIDASGRPLSGEGAHHGYSTEYTLAPGQPAPRICVTAVNVGPGADVVLGCSR